MKPRSHPVLYITALLVGAVVCWLLIRPPVVPPPDSKPDPQQATVPYEGDAGANPTASAPADGGTPPGEASSLSLERSPADEAPPSAAGTDGLPVAAQEVLEEAQRALQLDDATVASLRVDIAQALLATRQAARAKKVITEDVERGLRVYDFPPDAVAATQLQNRLAWVVQSRLGSDRAATLLAAWEQAAEADPALDGLRHHRQILILPSREGIGWQFADSTFTADGELVAARTVFPSLDEDGELVWPEEYRVLLPE